MSRVFAFNLKLGSVRIKSSTHAIVRTVDGDYTAGLLVKGNHINTYENTTYPTLKEAFDIYLDATHQHSRSGDEQYVHRRGLVNG